MPTVTETFFNMQIQFDKDGDLLLPVKYDLVSQEVSRHPSGLGSKESLNLHDETSVEVAANGGTVATPDSHPVIDQE